MAILVGAIFKPHTLRSESNFLRHLIGRACLIALLHPLSVTAVLSLSLKYQRFRSDNTRTLVIAKRETKQMNSELRELNRVICNRCDQKDYEKCRACRIYQLVNRIVAR
jgi:hypothetical protein